MASSIRAIVLGGSGNVGSRVVAECVKSEAYTDITVLSRRPLPEYDNPAAHQNKVKVHVVSSFDDIETIDLSKHNAAFMLMGIGQPSKASQQDLQKIDCDIPVSFATACHKSGIEHMSVLSSVGADPTQEYSWVTRTGAGGGWYNHVKGMMEQKTSQVGFSSVRIFRPAMIYPGNTNSPALLGRLNESLNWLLPAVYNSVGTTLIAEAMVYGMQQQMRTGAVVAGEGDTASSDSDSGSGSSSRVCIIEGGGAIRESAQASVKEHT